MDGRGTEFFSSSAKALSFSVFFPGITRGSSVWSPFLQPPKAGRCILKNDVLDIQVGDSTVKKGGILRFFQTWQWKIPIY